MPSSISNSSDMKRIVPEQDWIRLATRAVCITFFALFIWEMYWRSQGYAPTLNDSKEAWSLVREQIDSGPKRTVLIGASRMLYDFDLYVWQKARSELPLQLSTVGTNGSIYLKHLAEETDFRGLLLVGITPPLLFVPEGLPVETPTQAIDFYKRFTIAQRLSHYLYTPSDLAFGFLQETDLPLQKLFERAPISNRLDAKMPPRLPPHFLELDFNRQGGMTTKMEQDPKYQELVQNIWTPLFTPPPPPPHLSPEKFKELFMRHVDEVIQATRHQIEQIRKRGGRVVFIRFPSSHNVRMLEDKFAPRKYFWDRLVNEGKPDQAIHFEDYEQLQRFRCPEWSHLTRADAREFTRELLNLLTL